MLRDPVLVDVASEPGGSRAAPSVERFNRQAIAVLLIVVAFLVYNANLRSITSFDTYATRFLPISILTGSGLTLDEFPFLRHYPAGWGGDTRGLEYPYYVVSARGHIVSHYPVMTGVLSVPVYAVPVLLGLTNDVAPGVTGYSKTEVMATLLSKISAALWISLSVAVVYLTALRITNRSGALWLALIYAFATSSWSVSSQGLWQTSASQPLLALTLYFFVTAKRKPSMVVCAGVPLALAVAARPTVFVFAVVFTVYVAHSYRAWLARYTIVPAVIGVLLLAYNVYYFGNIVGPYSGVGGVGELSEWPRLDSFLGLLMSPSRGLLVYSPVLVLSFAGLAVALWQRRDPLLVSIAVATLLTLLVYASWVEWDGAFSYSYRFLVDLLPGLVLLMATVWHQLVARRWAVGAFAVATAFSSFVQIVGAYDYPCGWFETPAPAYIHRERYWDWRDPEFLRCAQAGPLEPDGVRLVRQMLSSHGPVG